MVHTFGLDLFNDPFFIGFNHTLQRLNHVHTANPNNYPPYNVVKKDEETWVVEMAVAGFSRDQITVTEQDGTLIIEGAKDDNTITTEYLHKGIGTRKFKRTFALGEYAFVKSAELTDGILYVTVEIEIPEEKKPKTIKVR